ncbi:MAG: AAA family ATPase [Microthrixaceae bacterium]
MTTSDSTDQSASADPGAPQSLATSASSQGSMSSGGSMSPERFAEVAQRIEREIAKVIVGQTGLVRDALICLLAEGHLLIEGVPGLGKTQLVNTIASVAGLDSNRIQFTPDLMPADIVGTQVLVTDESGGRSFRFEKGPVFTSLLLADEINRATPKTQAALLEAMQERQVTAGGQTRKLARPFLVLATQNPIEQEGTYPLPEAQLDRFLLKGPGRDAQRRGTGGHCCAHNRLGHATCIGRDRGHRDHVDDQPGALGTGSVACDPLCSRPGPGHSPAELHRRRRRKLRAFRLQPTRWTGPAAGCQGHRPPRCSPVGICR